MSKEKNKSFMDEIQEKYEISGMRYTPAYYTESGMILTLKLLTERKRPECPICSGRPKVHGYIKNGKIRSSKRRPCDI